MILSEFINFFSRLSESAGLYPNTFICMLIFFLLLFISACYILIRLTRSEKELIAVERELDEIEQNLGLLPPEANLTQNHPIPGLSNLNLNKHPDIPKQDDVDQKTGTVSLVLEGLKRQVLWKMANYLPFKKKKTTAGLKNEEFVSSLKNNPALKKTILDRISKTDKLISLQHLAKHLSLKRFDGNYHPILNELDQLEREGEIECQVINGKVFFKKKEKTKRKYILRKGRNFRKYIG